MLNHIVIMGRLARDPELRRTQSGIAVTTITVAVDRDYQSRDSQDKQADFIDVVAWRNTAEFINNYFTRGQEAAIKGRLANRQYEDRDGKKRYVTEVVIQTIDFCGSKNAARDGEGYERKPTVQEQQQFEELTDDDGELPF